MVEAPVGWQCRGCVKQGARSSPVRRWRPAPAGAGRLGATRITRVVGALIAVNVVVYLWQAAKGSGVYSIAGVPVRCAQIASCRFGLLPYAVHHGQWYRLITAAFLHANPEHIFFNMLTLAIVGSPLEAELGWIRFLALYLASALGGSVASYLLGNQFVPGVGASGAIFGLMGAYFVLARNRRWDTGTILGLIVVNLVISFSFAGIDWRAHVGGLITGLVIALGTERSRSVLALSPTGQVAAGVAVAAVVSIALALLVLLPPGNINL